MAQTTIPTETPEGIALPDKGEIEIEDRDGVWFVTPTGKPEERIGGYDPRKWPQFLLHEVMLLRTRQLEMLLNGYGQRLADRAIRGDAEQAAAKARELGAPEYVITEYVCILVRRYNFDGRGNRERSAHLYLLERLENDPDTFFREMCAVQRDHAPPPPDPVSDIEETRLSLTSSRYRGCYRAPKYRRDWHWQPSRKQLQSQRPEWVAPSSCRDAISTLFATRERLNAATVSEARRRRAIEAFRVELEQCPSIPESDEVPAPVVQIRTVSSGGKWMDGDIPCWLHAGVTVVDAEMFMRIRRKLWVLIPRTQRKASRITKRRQSARITIGDVQIVTRPNNNQQENTPCAEESPQTKKQAKPTATRLPRSAKYASQK